MVTVATLIKSFRNVYPERSVIPGYIEPLDDEKGIVEGKFPDGTFFFIVSENSVSSSYDTFERAKTAAADYK